MLDTNLKRKINNEYKWATNQNQLVSLLKDDDVADDDDVQRKRTKLENSSLTLTMTTTSKSLYDKVFRKSKLPSYDKFDSEGTGGIPKLVKLFKTFDAQNTTEECKLFNMELKNATYIDHIHLYQYLIAPEFNVQLLSVTTYDHVINAIISFMLNWTDESIIQFTKQYPQFRRLCETLILERAVDNYAYVFEYRGVPFIKTAIKVVRKHFDIKSNNSSEPFSLMALLNREFVDHIKQVFRWLLNDEFDSEKIKLLETYMPIPYKLENIHKDIDSIRGTSNFKFFTGEACCGKTTLLESFKANGWKIYSRGDVGSFSGKSNSPAAVGNLHAALDYILTQPDVIGDRGYIDNVLWSFIMPACNPTKVDTVVMDMFRFFNANFNEPSIAQYITQKGVVFIDPFSKLNAERMLKRCTDGDAHRGRLTLYPTIQFLVYYTAARLFGWKIFCVPYTEDLKFDPIRYVEIADQLQNYFGKPRSTNTLPFVRFSKPANDFEVDNFFPKSVGIFK